MATIETDFDVYKMLTAMRETESVTYNDVLRRMLNLPALNGQAPAKSTGGVTYRGVRFPDGTQFQAAYKGTNHTAEIKGGRWIGEDGIPRNSPSDAAGAITKNSVNGWRFWRCKRPSDPSWQIMDAAR